MKVAMVVIDGNEDFGSQFVNRGLPTSLHPAIQFVLEGLVKHPEVEIGVFFGAATPPDALQASNQSTPS
jgi:hypothetical protein